MHTFARVVSAGSVALAVGIAGVPASHAATTGDVFSAWAGGTTVHLLGGAIYSDQTANTGITSTELDQHSTNQLVRVDAPGIASVGVVTTSADSAAITGGAQVTAQAETAGINLLGGLITADVAKTTGSVSRVNGAAAWTGGTQLVNLTIAGAKVPVNVGVNTNITIPGIATVVVNRLVGSYQGNGYATVDAEALRVTLLGAYGSAPIGSTIDLSPVHATITSSTPFVGDPVGGSATSAYAVAKVNLLGIQPILVGPLSATAVPAGGTGGKDATNTTLGTNLTGLLVSKLASSTANGSVTDTFSQATESVTIAHVNLLNGLITADALSGSTTSSAPRGGAVMSTATATLVNLRIAGALIPVNVVPNTRITIPGVLTVTINRQVRTATGMTQQILDVQLLGGSLLAPIGAEIQVGTTNTWVQTAG